MGQRREQGFTLIEMAVVLVIIGLILGMGLSVTGAYLDAQRLESTRDRLDAVQEALTVFVSQYKRLPCPADGTAADGTELRQSDGDCESSAGGTWNQQTGVVPWVTLGLSEADSLDAWGRRLTYRVDDLADGPTSDDGMDNIDWANATTDLQDKGLRVADAIGGNMLADPAASTGAAYVLISHGRNGAGAYNTSGSLLSGVGTVGTDEGANANNTAVSAYLYDVATAEYVDRLLDESDDTSYFDDLIRRPTIAWLAIKAGLGPEN